MLSRTNLSTWYAQQTITNVATASEAHTDIPYAVTGPGKHNPCTAVSMCVQQAVLSPQLL